MENDNYKSQFDVYVAILEAYAGGINVPPDLVDGKLRDLYPSLSEPNNSLLHHNEAATQAAKEQYLACMLLVGMNNANFGGADGQIVQQLPYFG